MLTKTQIDELNNATLRLVALRRDHYDEIAAIANSIQKILTANDLEVDKMLNELAKKEEAK